MNNKKINRIDFIFIIGIIIIAIIGVLIDGLYWNDVENGGFPVFSCMSIFASYLLLIILSIYSLFKFNDNKNKYVKWSMFIFLPFFHIAIIIILLLILALFINLINM